MLRLGMGRGMRGRARVRARRLRMRRSGPGRWGMGRWRTGCRWVGRLRRSGGGMGLWRRRSLRGGPCRICCSGCVVRRSGGAGRVRRGGMGGGSGSGGDDPAAIEFARSRGRGDGGLAMIGRRA